MGADQIAAIRPALVELADAARSTDGVFVARFVVAGDESKWAEVILGTVNLAYPYTNAPLERLKDKGVSLLPGLSLTDWRPELFATFDYEIKTANRDVAKFVDRILEELLAAGSDYEVDVIIERLSD